MKNEFEINEKALSTKISIKDMTINDLLEDKKKLTVDVKILAEKLQFSKILEETKEENKDKKQDTQDNELILKTKEMQ